MYFNAFLEFLVYGVVSDDINKIIIWQDNLDKIFILNLWFTCICLYCLQAWSDSCIFGATNCSIWKSRKIKYI